MDGSAFALEVPLRIVRTSILATISVVLLSMIGSQPLLAQVKAPAYVITELEVINADAFKEYSPKVPATLQPFGGKYVARGGQIISSDVDAPKRVVIIAFESLEKALGWRDSAASKDLAALRIKAIKSRSYIVEGLLP